MIMMIVYVLHVSHHEPCVMDLDSEHLTPATFFGHHHLNPLGILG